VRSKAPPCAIVRSTLSTRAGPLLKISTSAPEKSPGRTNLLKPRAKCRLKHGGVKWRTIELHVLTRRMMRLVTSGDCVDAAVGQALDRSFREKRAAGSSSSANRSVHLHRLARSGAVSLGTSPAGPCFCCFAHKFKRASREHMSDMHCAPVSLTTSTSRPMQIDSECAGMPQPQPHDASRRRQKATGARSGSITGSPSARQ